MAQTTSAALDRRIRSTVETAESVYSELCGGSSLVENGRIEVLIKAMEKCCAVRESLNIITEYDELDQLGVKFWNLATQLSTDDDGKSSDQQRILNLRILAFFMLDCAEWSSRRNKQGIIRLLKLALKAGRECVVQKQLPLALRIMEKAARYHEEIEKMHGDQSNEEKATFQRSSVQFYTLRMTIAWLQSNLSMTEFMYTKASAAHEALGNASESESLASAILIIGKGLLSQKVYDTAIKWLRRALNVLDEINPLCTTEPGTELRYCVLHSLVMGCIQNKTKGDLEYARNALETMIADWPTRIAVHRLKLDVITTEDPEAIEEYHVALLKMIGIAQFDEDVLKTVLGRIQILADRSVQLACSTVDNLISKRLLALEKNDWIERAFITRLWMSVKKCKSVEGNAVVGLMKLLESMARQLSKPFSPKGTHAAQILLWKVSEAFLIQEKYVEARDWCEVALHKIFDKTGDLNCAKLARRMIHCSIQVADYDKAMEVYQNMSEAGKQSPNTQFLMFRVALRTSNNQLSEASIRSITEQPLSDYRALYACALDAHAVGNEMEALRALKYVLRHIDDLPVDSLHKPAVFRCAIRLTIGMIDHAKGGEISNIESLCRLLELASDEAKKSRTKKSVINRQDISFTVKELEWFSRASYNLSLRSIEEWHLTASVRIVSICIKFLELYPDDIDASTKSAVSLKAAYCHFLYASLGTQVARGEDNIELRLQHYLEIKRQIQLFRERRLYLREGLAQDNLWDLTDKYSTLLLYEFEACINLKGWDDLSAIVSEAEHCENPRVVQYFGDMILQSQAPDRTIMPLMKKILEALILNPNHNLDVAKLAKCVRCQVQLSLIRDSRITEQLIGEVLAWAHEFKGEYPDEELRWLSTTAWNKAVEFKGTSDQANYQKFGELAISVAKLVQTDGGKLLARIQRNYLRDTWD